LKLLAALHKGFGLAASCSSCAGVLGIYQKGAKSRIIPKKILML